MKYLELINSWEQKIKIDFQIELLEVLYQPYSFGCGMSAYRIKGKNIKLFFDGRDKLIEIKISKSHEKYPNCSWNNIGNFEIEELLDSKYETIKKILNDTD